jgi:hypothetical protein
MLVGWGILSPLSKYLGWAPGLVGDMTTGARGWILWTALAIMCADSVVSLLPVFSGYIIRPFWKSVTPLVDGGDVDSKEDCEVETEDRLVSMNWVIGGTVVSVVLGVILVWMVFGNEGIKPWATVFGFVIGGMLSVLGLVARGPRPYILPSFNFTQQGACIGRN